MKLCPQHSWTFGMAMFSKKNDRRIPETCHAVVPFCHLEALRPALSPQAEDGRRECIDLQSVMIRAGIFHGYFIGNWRYKHLDIF